MKTTIDAFNFMMGRLLAEMPDELSNFLDNDVPLLRISIRTTLYLSCLLHLLPAPMIMLVSDDLAREMLVDRIVVGVCIIANPGSGWPEPFGDPLAAKAFLLREAQQALGLAVATASAEPN